MSQTCAYHPCSRPVDAPREAFSSPSPTPEFCSWGCWNGDDARKMWAEVASARVWRGADLTKLNAEVARLKGPPP